MGFPTPKYSVGDSVYRADVTTNRRRLPCPDCGDTKTVQLVTKMETLDAECPRCVARMGGIDPLEVTEYVPSVRPLTIGSVKVDTEDEPPVKYMAHETGVGSGTVHPENALFLTYDEALQESIDRAYTHDRNRHDREEYENRHIAAAKPLSWAITEPYRRRVEELEKELDAEAE